MVTKPVSHSPPFFLVTYEILNKGNRVSQSEWSAELQFRATGQERGGGNLQLWYTNDGQSKIGTSSIYTVGPFDGFALVIDSNAGTVGTHS